MTTVLIVAIIAIISIAVILAVVIYNQMLLLNQINKRLLLITKESIEKERMTMDELQERLDEFEAEHPIIKTATKDAPEEYEEPFDPHTYNYDNLQV